MISTTPITLTVEYETDTGEMRELQLSADEAASLAEALRLGLRMVAEAKRITAQ